MSAKTASLLKEALRLPMDDRAAMAESLLESIEQEELVLQGAKEADRRWQAFKRREMGAKSLEQVMERLRTKKK